MRPRISCLLLFFTGSLVCLAHDKAAAPVPPEAVFAPPVGSTPEDDAIRHWQNRATAGGGAPALERLGWAYVAKARATQDDRFYAFALAAADIFVVRHGSAPEEQLLRGHALLSLHRFQEAESVARELAARRGGPRDYALWSDALAELGRIEEAVPACGRFVSALPGLESYSRVAHLRWLTGDLPGARSAMLEALRASSPGAGESHAWALVRLADYELQGGAAGRALELCDEALRARPGHPPALLGRGQALLALGRMADALTALAAAAERVPEPNYQWWLADAQRLVGDEPGAARTEATLIRRGPEVDPRTTSLFLATRGRGAARAVALARHELENRADPLTLDALAWAQAAAGETAAAGQTLRRIPEPGPAHPRLHLHAGCVARALGRADEARAWFDRAAAGAAALTPSERDRLLAERTALSQPKLAQAQNHQP